MVFPVLVFVHGNDESASDWDRVEYSGQIAARNHLTNRPQIIDRPTIMIRTTR